MNEENLVLIAEDDDISYQFLSTVFTKFGVPHLRASTGTDAIKIINENSNIKLIMMDIKMPHLDGLSATKSIKQSRPEVIVVAQTAYALNSEKAELLREGCDDYISKPIDIEKLKQILINYLKINI